MIDLPPQSYEQTIEAIVQCDVPRANIRIAYEGELQSDEITISNLGDVNEEKLRCLKAAVHPFYILTIADQAQQTAFYELSRRVDRPAELAKARDWVRSKGLLDQLPNYSGAKGLQAFADAVEGVCGLKVGSALMVIGPTSVTVRPEFLLNNKFEASARAMECLLNVFAASDATEQGVSFGFIGNAAIVEEDKN